MGAILEELRRRHRQGGLLELESLMGIALLACEGTGPMGRARAVAGLIWIWASATSGRRNDETEAASQPQPPPGRSQPGKRRGRLPARLQSDQIGDTSVQSPSSSPSVPQAETFRPSACLRMTWAPSCRVMTCRLGSAWMRPLRELGASGRPLGSALASASPSSAVPLSRRGLPIPNRELVAMEV